MSGWRFLLGNVLERAAVAPAAGAGSTEDSLAGLAAWRDGTPQKPGLFAHDTDGTYAASIDLNVLKYSSVAADAPFGWRDLLFGFTRTPGLPENAVTLAVNVFSMYRASFQEWTVFAGETWKIVAADVKAAIGSGSGYVKLQEMVTGEWYTGTGWTPNDASIQTLAAGANAALSISVAPNPNLKGRGTYRLIVTLDGTWDAARHMEVTSPAAYPQVDAVALVGANIPNGSAVSLAGGPTWTLEPAKPSFYAVDQTPTTSRTLTLTITHPAGAEVTSAPPGLGELFLGLGRTLEACPLFPFDVKAKDPAQVRIENGSGGVEAASSAPRSLVSATMRFDKGSGKEAAYQQAWELLYLGTRAGVDPLVLVPEITDPGLVIMGRLKPEVAFTRKANLFRAYELTLDELPFPEFP